MRKRPSTRGSLETLLSLLVLSVLSASNLQQARDLGRVMLVHRQFVVAPPPWCLFVFCVSALGCTYEC